MPERPKNSAVLREINDRILEMSTASLGSAATIGFLCECGRADCVSVVTLPMTDYEALRSSPGNLVLQRGHASGDAEDVAA